MNEQLTQHVLKAASTTHSRRLEVNVGCIIALHSSASWSTYAHAYSLLQGCVLHGRFERSPFEIFASNCPQLLKKTIELCRVIFHRGLLLISRGYCTLQDRTCGVALEPQGSVRLNKMIRLYPPFAMNVHAFIVYCLASLWMPATGE